MRLPSSNVSNHACSIFALFLLSLLSSISTSVLTDPVAVLYVNNPYEYKYIPTHIPLVHINISNAVPKLKGGSNP